MLSSIYMNIFSLFVGLLYNRFSLSLDVLFGVLFTNDNSDTLNNGMKPLNVIESGEWLSTKLTRRMHGISLNLHSDRTEKKKNKDYEMFCWPLLDKN